MPREIAGSYKGAGRRIAIVVSRFNDFITSRLVEGAVDALRRHEVADEDIHVYRVPGAWELPPVAHTLGTQGKHDAVVCLGAVIRGATPHFDHVATRVARGIAAAAEQASIPVIFGVLTCDTLEQAVERAGTKAGNRGADAALAALEMIDLYAQL
jgi:6,7-dimethyl-8-ribityllumazine synthase